MRVGVVWGNKRGWGVGKEGNGVKRGEVLKGMNFGERVFSWGDFLMRFSC